MKLVSRCVSVFCLLFIAINPSAFGIPASLNPHAGSVTTATLRSVIGIYGLIQSTSGPVSYAYDELGRLIAIFDANGNAAVYSYDAVGNILSITRYSSSQVSIVAFTPGRGASGATVRISGTGFSATSSQDSVQFNGSPAVITSATATEIDAIVPNGASTGPITVTSSLGSATSASTFAVTTSDVPTVTGFTPAMGMPGTAVTVNGTNFNTNSTYDRLRFNISSALVTSSTNNSLTTTFPSGGMSGHISVTTPAGTGISTDDFFTPFGGHAVADIAFAGRASVGGTANMTLNASQKIGLLLFDAAQGQHISLQWVSTIGSCALYLFAPNGVQINLVGANGTQITSFPCSGTSGGTSGGLDNIQLAGAGTYTIGVEDSATTGTLAFTLGDVSDITAPISIDGPPVTVTTTHIGQDARLSFTASVGQRVVVQASNVTNNGATVFLIGPAGQTIASLGILSTPGQIFFMDTQLLSAAGQYTLWVKHNTTNTGSATLQLNSVPPDFTAPITIGGSSVRVPAAGNTAVGQNALLLLTAAANQKFSIATSNGTYPSGLCTVTVKDPSGVVRMSGVCGGASGFTDTVTASTAGTYSIVVDPVGMATGNVTVAVSDDSDVTGTIAIDGPPVTATTTVQGQDARLTFTASAQQRVVLQVSNVSNPSAGVYLLKPDGTIQSSVAISNGAGQAWFMDTQVLAAAGTYTLWIAHVGTNIGSETLQLNSVPADFTAPITIGGSAVRVPSTGNTALGQNANLTFTATSGQKVSVTTSGGTFSSCVMYIRDVNGTNWSSGSCSGATGFIDSTTLSAGSYSVYVDPQGMATGTATVSLNNTSDLTGTITIDGSPVNASTTIPGQDERLTFNATAGQRVVLRISSVTNPNFSVYILKPDGTTQTSMGIVNGGGQTWFVDTQVLAAAGQYTIWIAHSGTNTGSETLQLNSVPADFSSSITVGGATVRVPSSGNNALGQNASLTFSATAGQTVNINLSSSTYSPSNACLLTLKDPSGNPVQSAYCGSGANSPIVVTPASTGTYTLFIDPQGMAVGTVTIGLNSNNDVTGTISIDGSAVTIATTTAGQDARLTFTGSSGQRVVVRVTGVTNPSATLILVRPDNSNQATVGISNNPSGQTWFMDTQTLASTGTYTLWIQHSGSNIGSETLQLSSVPADFTAPITPGGAAVRVPASGDTAVGQNGILTFTGSANQKISMSISNGTYSPLTNCVASLKNATGSILSSGYCGNGAASFIDTVALGSAGTYTVFVDPQGLATGNTTIQVNDSSDITGVIATDGTPVTAAPGIGQDARYTFTATAGQRVALRVTSVTNPSATVLILKPDGSQQASVSINNNPAGQLFFIDTQSLATAGTYTVWVRHIGANVGSATLQLNTVPADYTASLTLSTATQVPATGNLAIGQNARLTFSGTAGFQINALFSSNTIGPVTVTVLKPDGTTLSSSSSSASTFNFLTAVLPSTGTYTLVIDPTGAASGSISVLLTQVGGSTPVPNRTGTTVNPANPLSQNLVGLFLMNEGSGTTDKNIVDAQTASFAGSTLPTWNTTDPSVILSGTTASLSSYLDAGTDLNFDQLTTNKMTVVAKIFLNSVTTGGIAEKTDDSVAGFTFGLDSTGALHVYVPKSSSAMHVATGTGSIISGQWAQVAFTWDGTVGTAAAAHVYVNGVEQTKAVAVDGADTLSYANATNKSFRIGNNSYTGTVGSLNGKVAYMAVYKYRVLTATELSQLDSQLPVTTDVVNTATENGTPTAVTTTTAGQNAHVSFQGWANQQVTEQLTNNTMGQVTVNLVAPDGSTVATTTSSASSFSVPQATLPLTGTYDVFVQGPSVAGSITVGVVTTVGARANGSVIDTNNALSTNLVGLFLMNEATGTTDKNVVDGQTASFAGTTAPAWNTGDPSIAIKGTTTSLSSYLDAGTDLSFDQLPTNKMTVVARVFLNSVTAGGIAEKTDDSIAGFTFGLDSTGALHVYVPKNNSAMHVGTGAGSIISGQWVQVAFTWDGTVGTASAAHIYVNGVEQTKAVAVDGAGTLSYANATNKSFRIGNNSYTGTVGSLNGKVAYMAVYRGRTLTTTELNQLDVQLPIH